MAAKPNRYKYLIIDDEMGIRGTNSDAESEDFLLSETHQVVRIDDDGTVVQLDSDGEEVEIEAI